MPVPAVVLACRDEKRGEQLRVHLEENAKEHGNSKPQAEVMLLDVSSLQSVRNFAQHWNQQQRPLHCLINNAGIFNIGGSKDASQSATSVVYSHLINSWCTLTCTSRHKPPHVFIQPAIKEFPCCRRNHPWACLTTLLRKLSQHHHTIVIQIRSTDSVTGCLLQPKPAITHALNNRHCWSRLALLQCMVCCRSRICKESRWSRAAHGNQLLGTISVDNASATLATAQWF